MKCPKCGSEMTTEYLDAPADENMMYLATICPNCGHEEKVEG